MGQVIESTVLAVGFPFPLFTVEGVRIGPVVAHALLTAFGDVASDGSQPFQGIVMLWDFGVGSFENTAKIKFLTRR